MKERIGARIKSASRCIDVVDRWWTCRFAHASKPATTNDNPNAFVQDENTDRVDVARLRSHCEHTQRLLSQAHNSAALCGTCADRLAARARRSQCVESVALLVRSRTHQLGAQLWAAANSKTRADAALGAANMQTTSDTRKLHVVWRPDSARAPTLPRSTLSR